MIIARLPNGLMRNRIQAKKLSSSRVIGSAKTNSTAVANNGPTRVSLFSFSLHHSLVGDANTPDTLVSVLVEVGST